MYLMKNFQKGGHDFCGFRIFAFFCENDSILRPFLVKFRFERPVLSSAKRTQNKHKNHWRAQLAKLLDVLSKFIMRIAKK